ncbi:MAG: type II secretion system protein [Ruminococcus sp.]|nr:type II secretion system protein [Ruminococcus sp.]
MINKIKKNTKGMTLVEVLVAMTIFTMMFMMVFGIMLASIKLNADTRKYDQEIDVQVEDAERYNPMAATVNGENSSSTDISEYDEITGSNKLELSFSFPNVSKVIEIDGYAYSVNSKDDTNGFSLKFFSSTRPDIANNKYWIRIFNVSSSDNTKLWLYLPKDDHGSFYLKNESEPYTTMLSKTVPINTALGVGFDKTDSGNKYFWVTTLPSLTHEQLEATAVDKNFIQVNSTNLINYDKETDGYIDIYYTDEGLMTYEKYQDYLSKK